jgi:hypothetical protein
MLGIHSRTIERYEAMDAIPIIYRLACESLSRNNAGTWAWTERKVDKSLARVGGLEGAFKFGQHF